MPAKGKPKTTQKPRTAVKKISAEEQRRKNALKNEIKGLILTAAGIFFVLSMMGRDLGRAGSFIREWTLTLLGGRGMYVPGIAFILHGFFLMIKFKPFSENTGGLYLYIMGVNIVTVFSFADPLYADYSFFDPELYKIFWNNPSYGGFIGQMLSKMLRSLFGESGAWIVVLLVSAVSFIIIFTKSITEIFRMRKLAEKRSEAKISARTKAGEKLMRETASGESESRKAKKPVIEASDSFFYDEPVKKKEKPSVLVSPDDAFEKKAEPEQPPAPKINEAPPAAAESKSEKAAYIKPSIDLLDKTKDSVSGSKRQQEVMQNVAQLEKVLRDFGIDASVSEVSVGPTVTRYELTLKPGIRVNKVVNLADDIAMSLAAQRVRIEAPIPGKSAIGIEVPNKEVATVRLAQIISSDAFRRHTSPLAVALGKDLTGTDLVLDVKSMPHLLIAGATGSGKSVCINTLIMSILYHSAPEDVRMILIDPKMVELNVYNEVPHLLIPVVTDPKDAAGALAWAVREMTGRYEIFAENRVRGIDGYNVRMRETGGEKMHHIILIIDELNDLMMVSAQQVEASIIRLSQLARAAGIHLVIATQRPSVNVITGVIKANIPTRISFAVMSQIDSRTILDMSGAEKLLGRGDMLYLPQDKNAPLRAQCAYVSDKEIERVVDFVKKKAVADYDSSVMEGIKNAADSADKPSSGSGEYEDELLPKAMEIAFEKNIISTSTIQRRLRLGYARAGRIIDEMEALGYVSGADGSKPRKVLITQDEYYGGSD